MSSVHHFTTGCYIKILRAFFFGNAFTHAMEFIMQPVSVGWTRRWYNGWSIMFAISALPVVLADTICYAIYETILA